MTPESLTQRQMAVEIARDVIKWLPDTKVDCGNYVRGEFSVFRQIQGSAQVQDYLPQIAENCRVCAMGACLLSRIRIYNDVTFDSLRGFLRNGIGMAHVVLERAEAEAALTVAFSVRQLLLIECAFEVGDATNLLTRKDERAAIDFGDRFCDNRDRLRAIMQNVIDNDGEFVP